MRTPGPIRREHVLPVVAMCTVSDIVLIAAGIADCFCSYSWRVLQRYGSAQIASEVVGPVWDKQCRVGA
jgi:hypothetical protein